MQSSDGAKGGDMVEVDALHKVRVNGIRGWCGRYEP